MSVGYGNSLHIAVIISAIVHGGIVLSARLNPFPAPDEFKKTELTYLKTEKKAALKLEKRSVKREVNLKNMPASPADINLKEILLDKSNIPRRLSTPFTKDKVFVSRAGSLTNKPQLSKPDIIAIKKKIALTPLEINKITSPSYISYYQIIREKIRRCAYQNYTSQNTGEVYLSFVISSNGSLAKAVIIEEKSAPNAYLKETALKSVSDASSFPPFPKDLDYPQLSFNVIISFEIE